MSRVKVTTLRSVHIGNGNVLQNNTDFIVDGKNIYIIDPKKVLDIIGIERLDYWVSAIERRENLKEFFRRVGKQATPKDYCLRQINLLDNFEEDDHEYKKQYYSEIRKCKELKECIHDGRGYPYIPGSSIKGAIRTALLSSILENEENINECDLLKDKNKNDFSLLKKNNLSSLNIENKIFGGIQDSFFKYLRVGDVIFEQGSEFAIHMINLNIRNKKEYLLDNSKSQIIEVIPYDNKAECNITLALDNYRLAFNGNNSVHPLPNEMQSLSSIFKTINKHTKKLIEEDIKFWEDISKEKEDADKYIDSIKDIIEEIENCNSGKECVLRVGHASGWRFTTGAWLEKYDWFNSKIVPILRDPHYSGYPFPKSRRIESYPDVLGFIKLSIIE